jgi:hypothetical protein
MERKWSRWSPWGYLATATLEEAGVRVGIYGGAFIGDDGGGMLAEFEDLVSFAEACTGVILLNLASRTFTRSTWSNDRERVISCYENDDLVSVAQTLADVRPILIVGGTAVSG